MKYVKFLFLVVCTATLVLMNFNVFASSPMDRRDSMIQSVSGKLSGDWYDANGNLVYSIHHGYVNGAKIIDCYDYVGGNPGGAIITILEANGPRSIRLDWLRHDNDNPKMVEMFGTPYLKVYDLRRPNRLLNTYYYQPYSSDFSRK